MVAALKARLVALGHFIVPKKRLGIVSFVIVLTLAVLIWAGLTEPAHAGVFEDVGNAIVHAFSSLLFWIASLFIRLAVFILSFIIEIAGYNGFIDARAVNYGWVMVRDLANMFFVVVLLLIAFGTILGIEQYEWKKLLVKLIFAAILVNFSRIICALIIDVAQVIMITFVNAIAATAGGNFINAFSLEKVLQISRQDGAEVGAGEVFIASVAAVGFSVAAMAIMAVFLVILLGRMITLWVAIVFSPIAFVLNVIPQTNKYASQWWSEFNNNVIVGPVVVFFLWLSFVTVGSGDIHTEISENSASTQKISTTEGGTSGADAVGGESAGLSRAMDWNQMANFAVALGILIVGAKVAGQLGATGASSLQKAANLGVKAAALAGGAVAAKWAYKTGKKGLGKAGDFALKKMPIVGKESWDRRGRAIKAMVGEQLGKVQARRNKKSSDLLKIAYDKDGKYSWWQRKKARARLLGATGSFKEKMVKDREEVAKLQADVAQYEISTTSSPVGQRKLQRAEDKRRSELRAEKKKAQYAASSEDEATERAKRVGEIFDSHVGLRNAKSAFDQAKRVGDRDGMRAAQEEIDRATEEVESQIRNTELNGKKLTKRDISNYQKVKTAQDAAAVSENITDNLDVQKQKGSYRAKATEARKRGEYLRAGLADQQAGTVELNKLKEVFKSGELGSNERAILAAQLMQQIVATRNPPGGGAVDQQKLAKLIKQKDALNDLNSTLGAYDWQKEEEEELRALGWNEPLTLGNAGRRFLSRKLGRIVPQDQEDAAQAEYRNLVGESEYRIRMRQLGAHAKNQMAQGTAGAYVFNETPDVAPDGSLTGLKNYEPGPTTEAGILATMRGWHESGDLEPRKMKQAIGSRQLGPNGRNVLINISTEEARTNAALFGPYTITNVSSKSELPSIGDLNGAELNDAELEAQLKFYAKQAADERAFTMLCKKLDKVLDRNHFDEARLHGVWNTRNTV